MIWNRFKNLLQKISIALADNEKYIQILKRGG